MGAYRFRVLPRWSADELAEAHGMALPAAQEDAEKAVLQAIAAHARESCSADAEAEPCVRYALVLGNVLALVRSGRREG